MPVFTDQLGRTISLPSFPQRIISLVPSITELLFDLGLEQEVTGITKFCVHPEHWFRSKTRVGGTKAVKPEMIHQLQPDLIIANKEENVKEQVEALAQQYPVYISDVNNLDDALEMIGQIGAITNTAPKADSLITHIQTAFAELQTTTHKQQSPSGRAIRAGTNPLQTAYLIWRNPYMTVGSDTFIHDMLTRCGWQNIFENATRYPEISVEQLQTAGLPAGQAGCQLLLLSSEPFPFREKHIPELQEQLPDTKIKLVDGEFFSWYGSRLLKAPAYFTRLLEEIG